MNNLVSWEYYCSLFNKITDSDEFYRLEALAEKEVRAVVGFVNWEQINENTYGFEALEDCICRTAETLADSETSGIGKGLSSVSNDGYSESYTVKTAEEFSEDMRNSIRGWLSGTGLVRAL